MIKNFKAVFFSIAFLFSLLLTGCSSTERDGSFTETEGASSEVDSSIPSSPAAVEDQVYKQSVEKEEKEQLKKRKSSDDDMERLD